MNIWKAAGFETLDEVLEKKIFSNTRRNMREKYGMELEDDDDRLFTNDELDFLDILLEE
jgi:hypothetical protein